MSMFFRLDVEINGHAEDRIDAIKNAANGEWEFDDWDEHQGTLIVSGYDYLGGGEESKKKFAKFFTNAVWRANGKFCNVVIHATCLDYLPYETYSLDEGDFERLKAKIEDGADMAAAKPK